MIGSVITVSNGDVTKKMLMSCCTDYKKRFIYASKPSIYFLSLACLAGSVNISLALLW